MGVNWEKPALDIAGRFNVCRMFNISPFPLAVPYTASASENTELGVWRKADIGDGNTTLLQASSRSNKSA